ncbi:MAG: SDR family NAD(P)-dependent oxidoreductase [Nocardia sp.]|nr:SDR family NAD(P)-dependent oxidoreductase [Nocardia sp.]
MSMSAITTPFGFDSTAAEIAATADLRGRRVVVTGAGAGIGAETARAIALTGAEVTLAVRDIAAGEQIAAQISATAGSGPVRVVGLDLSDLGSVRAFVDGWDGPLHVLVNNAGVRELPQTYTSAGWEMHFASNHLGHFALATGLRAALARDGAARVVSVSSSGHQYSPVVFDDLNFAFRPYDPQLAYGQSKTANVLFAVEATRRWAADGIVANALMPGAVPANPQQRAAGSLPPRLYKTVEQGAATSVLLAVSPLLEGVGGRYFVDCNETDVVDRRRTDLTGVARYALDEANADRLWGTSLELIAAQ